MKFRFGFMPYALIAAGAIVAVPHGRETWWVGLAAGAVVASIGLILIGIDKFLTSRGK